MISRRSLFGLALVPFVGSMPHPENDTAEIGKAFMPALDMKECFYFKPQPPKVYDDKDFANCTDIHGTMRRIKLHMMEQLREIRSVPDAREL